MSFLSIFSSCLFLYPSLPVFYANSRQAMSDGHACNANRQDSENEVGVRCIAYVYASNQVVRNVARRTVEEEVLLVTERGGAGITASSVVMCVRQGE